MLHQPRRRVVQLRLGGAAAAAVLGLVKSNEMCSDPKCTLGVHSEKGGSTGAQCEHSIKLTNPPGRGCSRSDGPSRTRPAADPTPSTNTRFRCDKRAAHSWRSATAPLLVRSASSSSTRRASAASGAPRNQGYGAAAVLGVPYRAPPSSLPGAVGDAAPTPAPSGTTAVGRGGGGGATASLLVRSASSSCSSSGA